VNPEPRTDQFGLNPGKNKFDNKANFRYLDDYGFRLMDASIFL
jgi:hypothetical protein